MDNVQFHIAEVIEDPHSDTYSYKKTNNFEITVKTYTDFYNRQEIQAIPFNTNIKQIPLVGEHVLLVYGLSAENNDETIYPQWYYVASFSLNSNVNANILKGISATPIPYVAPSSFKEQEVSPLQVYEGDVLVEGRFGNSIRLTSTVNGGRYSLQPTWKGNESGDPIIILSNGKRYQKDSFVVENIINDDASMYLTSTQSIPNLTLGTTNSPNSLRCYSNESQYAKSQLIGVADRIVLKAKTDVVVIDSPSAIILNTSGNVKIGSDTADQSMVHGDVLLTVLQKILNQLNKPIQCGTMTGTFLDRTNITAAQRELRNLLSQKYYINKT
jgi:hypothetical protein